MTSQEHQQQDLGLVFLQEVSDGSEMWGIGDQSPKQHLDDSCPFQIRRITETHLTKSAPKLCLRQDVGTKIGVDQLSRYR